MCAHGNSFPLRALVRLVDATGPWDELAVARRGSRATAAAARFPQAAAHRPAFSRTWVQEQN
jgi:hypothetical protein